MAALLSFASISPHINSRRRNIIFRRYFPPNVDRFRCKGEKSARNSAADRESEPENVLLKVAWYGSELLGIAASFIRPPPSNAVSPARELELELPKDGFGAVDRSSVVETIKEDYGRSYFVTGNLTLDAYEEDCEFADPAGSFRGLRRFKRNCTNFGSLLEKSNMKLMKWEDFEDKGVGHWRFSCILAFPWRPILSASGYTEYYFDAESGKVCRHAEHWNVPKMVLLKQILKPSRWAWEKKPVG
ncbi:uncharacterized protein LOC116202315 isoform X1 [Punica granatum]|uniref:Uncharacterized protein n=2 Tax=Punica granatum TaxID=22663 RepID=A0A2I0I2R5_PUNGR|nr:uncharacterized protein LOC116202315 isoform X1 [Punica granatum]PKI38285.1 hypothetical protein CRG98_041332 [Punica granatum]